MTERTIPEQILILETLISERAAIIYVIESAIADIADESEGWPVGYKTALEDEIENHKLALNEYQEGLKKIKQ